MPPTLPLPLRSPSILVVEDDPEMVALYADALQPDGYCVHAAESAAAAQALLSECDPDLIILDLMLPDSHGLLLCRDLRERSGAPVIVCSPTASNEFLLGLDLGADDFLPKAA